MNFVLLTAGDHPRFVDGTDDPNLAEAAGPAVLIAVDSAADDSNSGPDIGTEAPSLNACIDAPYRPLAYRESGADWSDIDFEAADH